MSRHLLVFLALIPCSLLAQESVHRAEQDREIRYWLLEPQTHQFRISHDFTVIRPGQKSVHSFVRKGSVVSPDAKMIDLDRARAFEGPLPHAERLQNLVRLARSVEKHRLRGMVVSRRRALRFLAGYGGG